MLLLREVLRFLTARGTPIPGDARNLEVLQKSLLRLPDVLDLFDGRVFLFTFEKPTEEVKSVGEDALGRHWLAVKALESDEAPMPRSPVNGDGKLRIDGDAEVRGGDEDEWAVVVSKKAEKEKKKRKADSASMTSDSNNLPPWRLTCNKS